MDLQWKGGCSMANSLLDFVMSLVRDPNAAAAYAADPTQAISDANLANVTSADVNHLIPVVAESLSMAVPGTGVDAAVDDHASNIWTSGAATAAFDAFDDHVPTVAADDVHSTVAHLVTEPDAGVHEGMDVLADAGVPNVPDVAPADDPSLHFDGPLIDDAPVIDTHDTHLQDSWSHSAPEDHHLDPDVSGFDIFDT
jgi:hypothetical protein